MAARRPTRLILLTALALVSALALATGATATGSEEEPRCPPAVATTSGGCGDHGESDDGDAAGDDGCEAVDPGDDEEPSDGDAESATADDDAAGDADAGDDDELVDAPPAFQDFCAPPVFDPAFLSRTWPVRGDVAGFDGSELVVTIESLGGVPDRWREQAALLEDLEAVVLVGRRVPVTHRRRGRVPRRSLRRARSVRVVGTVLSPAVWAEGEDGLLVPTVRARSVRIVR
jgi:hypothetical protein